MSTQNGSSDAGRDEQVRLRAYQIWEQEGRPEGRHEEHWRTASDEAQSQMASDDGSVEDTSGGASSSSKPRDETAAERRERTGVTGTGDGSGGGRATGSVQKRS